MSVRIEVDTSDVSRELRRLQDGPTFQDFLRMDSVLVGIFQETQVAVHVQTGSLQKSGKVESSFRRNTWRGLISYGGESDGSVHDPVRYALYEFERGRSHDFMRPTYYNAHHSFVQAIKDFLQG